MAAEFKPIGGPVCGEQVVRDVIPDYIEILMEPWDAAWDGRMTFELYQKCRIHFNGLISLGIHI